MNKFVRNLLGLALVLLTSYFTASYFGSLYDYFAPQHDSLFGAPKQMTSFVIGIPFAYVFFTIFIFGLFGFKEEKKWIIGLLIPVALLWLFADLTHIYLPIILGLIAFLLAWVIHKSYLKLAKR